MELTPQSNQVALFAPPPLLITESAHEFAALLAALQQEIRPNGIIEQIYSMAVRPGDLYDNSCSHAQSLNCFGRFGNRPNESHH